MAEKNETIPGAFQALVTGYGIVGPDFAHFPATSVPELSLRGDKPFTLFTTVCFKNVQGGAILEQKNIFQLGIMDGLIYTIGLDWCTVKFSESTLGKFIPQYWYTFALTYDGNLLTVYLGGVKKDTFKCKPASKRTTNAELVIGENLDAYFKNFLLFDRALSGEDIAALTSGEETLQPESLVWFDFSKYGRKSQSPNGIKIGTRGFGRIVIIHPVKQFRFNIDRRYRNTKEMLDELFETSKTVNFTGSISYEPADDSCCCLTGLVSLGTSKPIMCGVEGKIVTLWESIDIPQTY